MYIVQKTFKNVQHNLNISGANQAPVLYTAHVLPLENIMECRAPHAPQETLQEYFQTNRSTAFKYTLPTTGDYNKWLKILWEVYVIMG